MNTRKMLEMKLDGDVGAVVDRLVTEYLAPPARPVFVVDPVRHCLERVRAVLRQHGWLQRTYGDWSIGFCMAGAVRVVVPEEYYIEVIGRLWRAIPPEHRRQGVRGHPCAEAIYHYNDTVVSSQAEALAWVERAMQG